MWPNPQFPENLVIFTGKILNGKLHFLYSVSLVQFLIMYSVLPHLLGVTFKYARHMERYWTKIVFRVKQFVICLKFVNFQKNIEISENLKGHLYLGAFSLKMSVSCQEIDQQSFVLCNIPTDVVDVCSTLPHPADRNCILKVNFKRKISIGAMFTLNLKSECEIKFYYETTAECEIK